MDKSAQLKWLAFLIAGCGVLFHPISYSDGSYMQENQTKKMVAVNDPALRATLLSSLASFKNNISITVKDGVVHLSGQLDSNTDYEQVVTVSESTPGIVDVNANDLTVKDSQNPLTDIYMTAKVKGALIKSDIMGKDIPAWSVNVETRNGQVFLSGSVKSKAEEEHIISVVKSVNGVSTIVNEISVFTGAAD